MRSNLFYCFILRRNLFLKPPSHFCFNFSILAQSNVSNSNAPSQTLFTDFVTNRFNISSADAAKIVKTVPSLGRLKTLDKVEQFVYMLNRHGCTEDQIAIIIKFQPSLVSTSVERVLEPKIQLLKDSGMDGESVAKLITRCSWILNTRLENLRYTFKLLKTLFQTPHFLIRAIAKNPYIFKHSLHNTLESSVAFWEDFGFHGIELVKFLLIDPHVLTRSSVTPAELDLIQKFGIHKESKMYKYAVSVVVNSRIEVVEAKIDNLRLCGLSPAETWELFRTHPLLLNCSEENIKKKMNFMLNHMELSVDFVAKHPRMFTMSLDKVMRPRFLVLQNVTSMNGAGKVNPTRLYGILMMSEAKFVAKIIEGHPESAALWTVYKNAMLMSQKAQR